MKKQLLFLILGGFLLNTPSAIAATCSRAALTRCLDSVCAINIGANPAARCQYCGTSDAGEPPVTSMRSVSVGQSAKNTLSDKELKKAPTDPGQRYVWATAQCISKVAGCTADDVTDTYDTLIEQSCTAAGIDAQAIAIREKAVSAPTKTSCTSKIRTCVVATSHCNSDWRGCTVDAEFDSFLSQCIVDNPGCDPYTSDIRTQLASARTSAYDNADATIASLVKGYQDARQHRIKSIKTSCQDNSTHDACIESVCANNLNSTCEPRSPQFIMATQLCKFYEIACNTLK